MGVSLHDDGGWIRGVLDGFSYLLYIAVYE
jgi:hypothetical protein